jgi:hypothetical protein
VLAFLFISGLLCIWVSFSCFLGCECFFFGRVDWVFLWVLGDLLGWGAFGAGLGV